MSYTPTELVAALDRHGVEVTERRLTDWRAKGLLPPLKKIGLGRGKGTRQFWENDEVLQQAIAAEYFLYRKSRTRYALSRLWLAGFDVPVELGKATWLEYIEQRRKSINRIVSKRGRLEGWLSSTLEKSNTPSHENDNSELINELFLETLQLIYNQDIEFWDWERAKLIRDHLDFSFSRKGRVHLRLAVRFIYEAIKSLSIDNLSQTIATAGNAELKRSNIAIKNIRGAFVKILGLFNPINHSIKYIGQESLIISGLAPSLILSHLKFEEVGAGQLLDNSILIIVNALNELSSLDIILTDNKLSLSDHGNKIWESVKADLDKLWSEFEGDTDQWTTDSLEPLNPK